jgi:hypothetical protein
MKVGEILASLEIPDDSNSEGGLTTEQILTMLDDE